MAAMIDGMLSGDGSIRTADASPGAINSALVHDEENRPLMKETQHIPTIKERLSEEKIANILTASARGKRFSTLVKLQPTVRIRWG